MIDIEKVEAAVQAATPGPWEVNRSCNEVVNMDHGLLPFAITRGLTLIGALYENGPDAAHIATADPSTVLKMISMLRERDAVLKQALEALNLANDYDADGAKRRVSAIAAIKEVLRSCSKATEQAHHITE
jgi:hypothetical protein